MSIRDCQIASTSRKRTTRSTRWRPTHPLTPKPGTLSVFSSMLPARCPTGRAWDPCLSCSVRPTGGAALTFRIGPDFDSAREFVYKLGPQRLDELLSAKVVGKRERGGLD